MFFVARSLLLLLTFYLVTATEGASALDFNGYIRAGVGSDLNGGRQSCFKLSGAEAKYRLGNECEIYGEALFGQDLYQADGGPRVSGHVMASLNSQNGFENLFASNNSDRLPQAYLAAHDLAPLNGGLLWLGNRYYKREDVHINDFFYWNPSGIGMGVEDYGLGDLKLSTPSSARTALARRTSRRAMTSNCAASRPTRVASCSWAPVTSPRLVPTPPAIRVGP